jgi:hypothetical protein
MMCQAVAVFVVGRERATNSSEVLAKKRTFQRKKKEKEGKGEVLQNARSKFEVAVILRHSS